MMNKEYIKEIHNMDTNYEKILSKTKGVIHMKRKILNVAAIFVIVILIGATSGQIYAKREWDIKFKEYQNREYGFASTAVTNGYVENIDMDYVYQNGIGAKVDSVVVTDDHFESNLNFKFPESTELNSESFSFGYAVYDDESHLYGFSNRMHLDNANEKYKFDMTYLKCLYEELEIEYNKNDIFTPQYNSSGSLSYVSAQNNEIVMKLEMESVKGFPKSKKIYIRIFDLGFTMIDWADKKPTDIEDFDLSGNSEWIFELDIPEQMYNRVTTELDLDTKISGFELKKATLSETKLVLQGTILGLDEFIEEGKDSKIANWGDLLSQKAYITDSDGNQYYSYNFGTGQDENSFHADFNVNKTIFENNNLFLHITVDDKEVVSQLIEKK